MAMSMISQRMLKVVRSSCQCPHSRHVKCACVCVCCACVYVCIHSHIYPSIHRSNEQYIYLCIYPLIQRSIHPSIHRSIYPSIYPPTHSPTHLPILVHTSYSSILTCSPSHFPKEEFIGDDFPETSGTSLGCFLLPC